ncbi:MAG: hypothetical protein V4462_04845 [Pseudomonadota bacterium]
MKLILTDQTLRNALYALYVALLEMLKEYPAVFTKADATRMLTGLTGSRPWSWRVIGITRDALDIFAANNFMRVADLVQRGHKNDRASTAQLVFLDRNSSMPLAGFFDVFLLRDQTVLMTKEKNKHLPVEFSLNSLRWTLTQRYFRVAHSSDGSIENPRSNI